MSDQAERFYTTGGTLPHDAPSYVEREADRELFDCLRQGDYCYVLTSRQMGKSSLMVRVAAKLREVGTRVAALDLTAVGQNLTPDQWYDGLLLRLGRQLRLEDELEDFWDQHRRLGPAQRFFTALRDVVLQKIRDRLVVFVDELDTVRSLPFSTDEFFAAIRECFTRRADDPLFQRLTFCLLGVATPSDLIQDTRMTPFNVARRIELRDFAEAEAAPLGEALGRPYFQANRMLKRILYWTGGHPYLTQRLCRAVAIDQSVRGNRGVDRLCREIFLSNRARERDDNLLFVRERILRSEVDRVRLLRLYRKVHRATTIPGLFRFHLALRKVAPVADEETNPLVSVLHLSGITRVEDGILRVRNRIYYLAFDRDWIMANMPEVELWRLWMLFLTGLKRLATVVTWVLVVLLLIGLVVVLIARPWRDWDATAGPQRVVVEPRSRPKPHVPARPAELPASLIDLTPFYNAALAKPWHDLDPDNTLNLPHGVHIFHGIPFDVRGLVQLAGESLARHGFPEAVHGIPVRQRCLRIHFLHAAGWRADPGTPVAVYVVLYRDGRQRFIPILYGQDVLNWHPHNAVADVEAGATVAWEYRPPPGTNSRMARSLYLTTWTNPWPQAEIRSIDLRSTLSAAAPFVVAITVEPTEDSDRE